MFSSRSVNEPLFVLNFFEPEGPAEHVSFEVVVHALLLPRPPQLLGHEDAEEGAALGRRANQHRNLVLLSDLQLYINKHILLGVLYMKPCDIGHMTV